MSVRYIKISADRAGQRIDNYLFNELKKVPKSRIYKALRKGEVRVNRGRVQATYRLRAGDEVRVPPLFVPDQAPLKRASSRIQALLKSHIILENNELIVLDKPSGIPVHSDTDQDLGVIEIIKAMQPPHAYVELVHRLDKGTSGCLVLAKKRSILRQMHALLRARTVKKQYLALVKGKWQGGTKKVDLALRKDVLASGERRVRVVTEEGRHALSYFSPLVVSDTASLMLIKIETGRTHQIRVHAAALGFPIAGDDKYGDKQFNQEMKRLGLARLFLHAGSITFYEPDFSAFLVAVGVGLDMELKKILQKIGMKVK